MQGNSLKIGMIGAGAIAQFLLKEINKKSMDGLLINHLLVTNKAKYQALEAEYGIHLHTSVDGLLSSEVDLVVEAATVEAAQAIIPKVLPYKDVVSISIGAMADGAFYEKVQSIAQKYNRSIFLPSGAIGGLDLIRSAQSLGELEKVVLTTRKPANTLIDGVTEGEKVVFSGPAKEAIQQFPKNINVSIVLGLAGIGLDRTNVKLIADPHITKNIHLIEVKGAFGTASIQVENEALPENPKTSYLAALSILSTLKNLNDPIKIG